MIAICCAFRRPSRSLAFRCHSDAAGEGERAPEKELGTAGDRAPESGVACCLPSLRSSGAMELLPMSISFCLCTGQVRSGQFRSGQGRPGQVRFRSGMWFRLPTTYYLRPTTDYRLPTTDYRPPVRHYLGDVPCLAKNNEASMLVERSMLTMRIERNICPLTRWMFAIILVRRRLWSVLVGRAHKVNN